jgi:hypothetical protein
MRPNFLGSQTETALTVPILRKGLAETPARIRAEVLRAIDVGTDAVSRLSAAPFEASSAEGAVNWQAAF